MRLGALTIIGLIAVAAGPNLARADVMFDFNGTWSEAAGSTDVSAPDATVSFSFDLPDPLDGSIANDQATNFVYDLNGIPVSNPLTSIVFYYPDGSFDLQLKNDLDVVNLYGPAVTDSSYENIVFGTYSVTLDFDALNYPTGIGSGTLEIDPVPEPMSLWLFIGGLASLGMFLRRRNSSP